MSETPSSNGKEVTQSFDRAEMCERLTAVQVLEQCLLRLEEKGESKENLGMIAEYWESEMQRLDLMSFHPVAYRIEYLKRIAKARAKNNLISADAVDTAASTIPPAAPPDRP